MADLEALGDRLRHQRKRLGMRSRDVAQRAGVTQGYLWLIETTRDRQPSERRHVSRDVLVRWAIALNVDRDELGELLTLADYDPSLTRDEMAMLAGDVALRMIPERSGRYQSQETMEPDLSGVRELQDRLRTVVLQASVTDRHTEAMRLLDSYIDWLSYYVTR